MPIFYNPDTTAYPDNFLSQAIKCPGIEALTGADFAICKLPIPPTSNLTVQIKNRALFVQVKVGLDFDIPRLHSAIARMQSCKIPKGQAILLPIGNYYPDKDDGLLRVSGQPRYGALSFKAFQTALDEWNLRGGIVEHPTIAPKSIDDIMEYIELKQRNIDKVEKEGERHHYPPAPVFEPGDILQEVKEISDWRNILIAFDDCGNKTVNAVWNYAQEIIPNSYLDFFQVLCLMTDEDKKGKPIYNIPLWGNKKRERFRGTLGIRDGQNLGRYAFQSGWRAFGNSFVTEMQKRKKLSPKVINEILSKLMTEKETEGKNPVTGLNEDEIPF